MEEHILLNQFGYGRANTDQQRRSQNNQINNNNQISNNNDDNHSDGSYPGVNDRRDTPRIQTRPRMNGNSVCLRRV